MNRLRNEPRPGKSTIAQMSTSASGRRRAHECHGNQQCGEQPRTPVGTRSQARLGLGWVDFAQHVLRDGDVGRGDEYMPGAGGHELRHVEAGRATNDRADVRFAEEALEELGCISSWA